MLCAAGTACDRSAALEVSTNEAPAAATEPTPAATPTLPPGGKVQRVGVWQPPAGLEQVPIWPGAAPDMAGVSWPAESVLTADTPEALAGRTSQAVFDVSVPTMTVFPPKGRNTGAAWRWFIDVFAVACLVFTVSGLFLLQMHARQRRSTWPWVALGLLLPALIALLFVH